MTSKKPAEPRELTSEERAHVESLHARFGEALSLQQIETNLRMSLGLPDANGRTPGAREQLGALSLFANLLVARPKADAPRGESGVVIVCRDPFCTCPPCSCGASERAE